MDALIWLPALSYTSKVCGWNYREFVVLVFGSFPERLGISEALDVVHFVKAVDPKKIILIKIFKSTRHNKLNAKIFSREPQYLVVHYLSFEMLRFLHQWVDFVHLYNYRNMY